MTRSRAERITGKTVAQLSNGRGFTYGLYAEETMETLLHQETAFKAADALSSLVEWHYREVRQQVFAEQHWRCWACFRIQPLQCDHIKPRGQGRSDDRLNLRGLCAFCHEQQTNNKAIVIDPRMAELMYSIGLRWMGEYVNSDLLAWGWKRIA